MFGVYSVGDRALRASNPDPENGDAKDLPRRARRRHDGGPAGASHDPRRKEATSGDLIRLGVRSIDELATRDPRELYEELCDIQRTRLDPCVLYVFRCAVYYASTDEPEPELTRWWNWKDREWPPPATGD